MHATASTKGKQINSKNAPARSNIFAGKSAKPISALQLPKIPLTPAPVANNSEIIIRLIGAISLIGAAPQFGQTLGSSVIGWPQLRHILPEDCGVWSSFIVFKAAAEDGPQKSSAASSHHLTEKKVDLLEVLWWQRMVCVYDLRLKKFRMRTSTKNKSNTPAPIATIFQSNKTAPTITASEAAQLPNANALIAGSVSSIENNESFSRRSVSSGVMRAPH